MDGKKTISATRNPYHELPADVAPDEKQIGDVLVHDGKLYQYCEVVDPKQAAARTTDAKNMKRKAGWFMLGIYSTGELSDLDENIEKLLLSKYYVQNFSAPQHTYSAYLTGGKSNTSVSLK